MNTNNRERIIVHGAIVLFVGLLCGFPAITEWGDNSLHAWRAANLGLIVTGVWLLATAAILPSLALGTREASGLVWSLVATGYGLTTALLLQAMAGVRGIEPAGPLTNWIAFGGNVAAVLGSLLATLLTLAGARASLKVPVRD